MKSVTLAASRGCNDSQSDKVATLLDRRRSIIKAIRLCPADDGPTDDHCYGDRDATLLTQ